LAHGFDEAFSAAQEGAHYSLSGYVALDLGCDGHLEADDAG